MSEKLKNKYQEILKERDSLLYENKRVRHDSDTYVKENYQVRKVDLRIKLNQQIGVLAGFLSGQVLPSQ